MSGLRIAALALALGVASSAQAQAFAEPPAWLHQLDLTEAQQEDVTQLYYEYAPAIRKQIQAGRRAHEDLENLAIAAQLQEESVREAVAAEVQALSEVAELRLRAMMQAYQLLTEEQRAKAARLLVRDE
jgi:periplasmic protein CpxP/Spy